MKKIVSFSALLVLCISVFAQSVTLTFTGKDANNYRVQLNRVTITNQTKGWTETIYWPDTTLTMQNGTGIDDYANNGGFGLSQNNPNPFNGTTDVLLTVVNAGSATLEIMDVNGRMVVETTYALSLPFAQHQFRIHLSTAGTYVMTARQNGKTSSIKMVNNGGGNDNRVEYVGIVETMCTSSLQPKSGIRGNTNNPFNYGDQMKYVGYATINGTEYTSAQISQAQNASQTFALQFNAVQDGRPCPGAATVTDRDGNTYNTVLIGNQCWMKENLRTTRYADNTPIPQGRDTSSTVAYRYNPGENYNNKPAYGLLYNWPAVMRNVSSSSANPSGVQGICPTGWHVPSDAEWTRLTDYLSSRSEYVCGWSNSNIAKSLADTAGWSTEVYECAIGNDLSANNATGFTAVPAGMYGNYADPYEPYFSGIDYGAVFWSATESNSNNAYERNLSYLSAKVERESKNKYLSYSVRCLRNEGGGTTINFPTVTTIAPSDITATTAIVGGDVVSDGGGSISDRGICYSTNPMPTVSDNCLHIGQGNGSFSDTLTGLLSGTTYYVRAFAMNSMGVGYGDEMCFDAGGAVIGQNGQPCPGAATLTDIDGNIYNTVLIGYQCWMKENLRTTKYADSTEAFYHYPYNDASSVDIYGLLYDWPAVMHNSAPSSANPSGVQGICPTGWHVPSDAEWTQLTDFLGSHDQYVCNGDSTNVAKALAIDTGWIRSTTSCVVGNPRYDNNTTGFSALASGQWLPSSTDSHGFCTSFWTSTVINNYATRRCLQYNYSDVPSFQPLNSGYGYSMRCIRD